MEFLELKDVNKVFYTKDIETHALSNISLRLGRGDFVSLVGQSGSGKSTLLSILGLLESPTSGNLFFMGKDMSNLPRREMAAIRNRNIGYVFQSFNLIGLLTVFENVELLLKYRGTSRDKRKTEVEAALERVGIAHRRNHYPSQLSGGQQQRTAIARAIVGSPSLIIADEPTGNLDTANGETVMNILTELNADGTTVFMATHNQSHISFSRRVISIMDGAVSKDQYIG